MNDIIVVSLWSMIIAQWLKLPILFLKSGKWDYSIIFSTGSMPSSHTAFVTSLTTAIGFTNGTDSSVFAISFVFLMITIHDAIKVRGENGKQAKVINILVSEVTELYSVLNIKDVNERDGKLKELIGHTEAEVVGGLVLGLLVSTIYFIFLK